jgi:hypothetical protein
MTGQPEVVDLLRVQFELMRFIRASILAASASILPDRLCLQGARVRRPLAGSRYAADLESVGDGDVLTLSSIDR